MCVQVDGLETERDFYFQKLRDIEIMCQAQNFQSSVVGSLELQVANLSPGLGRES